MQGSTISMCHDERSRSRSLLHVQPKIVLGVEDVGDDEREERKEKNGGGGRRIYRIKSQALWVER